MSDIIPVSGSSIVPSAAEREFFDGQKDTPFLPTLKLLHGTSDEIAKGHQAGTYFLTLREKALGKKVIICVLSRRPHALLLENNRKKLESFNYQSPIFQQIINTPDNRAAGVVTMWSPGDFLVYLPEEDDFATFFPGKRSSRPVALEIIDHMTPPADRRTKSSQDLMHTNVFELFATMQNFGEKNKAWVPHITAQAADKSFYPSQAAYEESVAMFLAPVQAEAKVEVAKPSDDR